MDGKMNPDVKAQWTAALRSGEYKQGKRVLTSNDGDCCLGVLCKLAVIAGVATADDPYFGVVTYRDADNWHSDTLPPTGVFEWAGLPVNNPVVEYQGEARALAALNDKEGLTFAQIADLIDKQL